MSSEPLLYGTENAIRRLKGAIDAERSHAEQVALQIYLANEVGEHEAVSHHARLLRDQLVGLEDEPPPAPTKGGER